MAKRGALTDLNRDNWDQDDETEEAGSFRKADAETLAKRVIKRATRRGTAGGTDSAGTGTLGGGGGIGGASLPAENKSVFGGFSGFGTTTQTKPPAATFSFLSSTSTSNASTNFISSSSSSSTAMTTTTTTLMTEKSNNKNGAVDNYNADLKELNQSFVKWIKDCVDKNPLCILTPIFDDYRKYLKELDEEKKNNKKNEESTIPSAAATFKFGASKPAETPFSSSPSSASTFSFGSKLASAPAAGKVEEKPSFAFGAKSDTGATPSFSFMKSSEASSEPKAPPPPTFTGFGTSSSSALGSTGTPFSFSSTSKPFSFGNVTQAPKDPAAAPSASENADNAAAADDDDEPPKVEFTPVVEEDSIYSKRCKVFVKQNEEYKDRGVGTLYIKSVDDGKKTQVIVRADTSLGNLLLNTLLSTSHITKRMGKNNVMIATVIDGKPTPVLLRVKTTEDADELLGELEKNKK